MTESIDPGGATPLLLRVTSRCLLEDLEGTTASDADRPVEELEPHLIRKFVAMRSQAPAGREKVQPLQTAQEVYTLHAGRWRGATWHDRENNVVWLLAGRLHRSGSIDDAYPYIKGLDAEGRLLPIEDDYERLFPDRARSFAGDVLDKAPSIIDEGRRLSPAEVSATLGPVRISVAVAMDEETEIVYLSVMMTGWSDRGLEPPMNWIEILWAAFFPWVNDVTEIGMESEIAGRPRKDNELIYSSIREA